jgi:hypothetical protein
MQRRLAALGPPLVAAYTTAEIEAEFAFCHEFVEAHPERSEEELVVAILPALPLEL